MGEWGGLMENKDWDWQQAFVKYLLSRPIAGSFYCETRHPRQTLPKHRHCTTTRTLSWRHPATANAYTSATGTAVSCSLLRVRHCSIRSPSAVRVYSENTASVYSERIQ